MDKKISIAEFKGIIKGIQNGASDAEGNERSWSHIADEVRPIDNLLAVKMDKVQMAVNDVLSHIESRKG